MENRGFVYIMRNSYVPHVVKIGRTNDLERRAYEMNAHAGVAGRWEVVGHFDVADMYEMERLVHAELDNRRDRNSGGCEIFSCHEDEAALAVHRVASKTGISVFKQVVPSETRAKIIAQAEQARAAADYEAAQQRMYEEKVKVDFAREYDAILDSIKYFNFMTKLGVVLRISGFLIVPYWLFTDGSVFTRAALIIYLLASIWVAGGGYFEYNFYSLKSTKWPPTFSNKRIEALDALSRAQCVFGIENVHKLAPRKPHAVRGSHSTSFVSDSKAFGRRVSRKI